MKFIVGTNLARVFWSEGKVLIIFLEDKDIIFGGHCTLLFDVYLTNEAKRFFTPYKSAHKEKKMHTKQMC